MFKCVFKTKARPSTKTFFLLALVITFAFSGFVSVAAATGTEEKGFVEYHTEASINFTEVVEVTLTNLKTGHCYTHSLYRANDYKGNMSVPLGKYNISAKVASDTGKKVQGYDVVYPEGELVIDNTHIAVPIKLRVEASTRVETSPDDYPSSGNGESKDETVDVDGTAENKSSQQPSASDNKDSSSSLLISSIFYFFLLLVAVIVFILVKRHFNKNDKG